MKELVVVDAACLIGLEHIGHLDVLPALFDPILIPPAVASEFGRPLPWLQTQSPANKLEANGFFMSDELKEEALRLAGE
ncbi:MAG: hypothetical protein ACREA2_03830 [Blastocatellia bacterium]